MGLLDIVEGVFGILQDLNRETSDKQREMLERADAYGKQHGQHLKPEYQRKLDNLRAQQRKPWERD